MNEYIDNISVDPKLIRRIGKAIPNIFRILPYRSEGSHLFILTEEGRDLFRLEEEISPFLAGEFIFEECQASELSHLLARFYGPWKEPEKGSSTPFWDKNPTALVLTAAALGASDIHIEAGRESCRIRLRIDGRLFEKWRLAMEEYPALVNRVKMQAGLDIAEKRLPQDGRMEAGDLDVRVSTLPALDGEKVSMRLLQRDLGALDIRSVGMPGAMMDKYLEAVRRAWGLVLISGPTGSGKTTTLYATLREIFSSEINILTVEDPVEYRIDGITQVQVRESVGLGFPRVLRTFLRQDPDIIMVGEIRDTETAHIAVRAALTGHLVLSTIHTNSAIDTFSRLTDMGIEHYLLAGTVVASVAQRLLRKLCIHCRTEHPAPPPYWPDGIVWPGSSTCYYEAAACPECQHTGHAGQTAIFELVVPGRSMKDSIRRGEIAGHHEYSTMSEQAVSLVAKGICSPAEVISIIRNQV